MSGAAMGTGSRRDRCPGVAHPTATHQQETPVALALRRQSALAMCCVPTSSPVLRCPPSSRQPTVAFYSCWGRGSSGVAHGLGFGVPGVVTQTGRRVHTGLRGRRSATRRSSAGRIGSVAGQGVQPPSVGHVSPGRELAPVPRATLGRTRAHARSRACPRAGSLLPGRAVADGGPETPATDRLTARAWHPAFRVESTTVFLRDHPVPVPTLRFAGRDARRDGT